MTRWGVRVVPPGDQMGSEGGAPCVSKCLYMQRDIVIYLSHDKDDVAMRLIQDDLNKLQKWCCMNKLTINCKKNKYVFM